VMKDGESKIFHWWICVLTDATSRFKLMKICEFVGRLMKGLNDIENWKSEIFWGSVNI
jgi:hypothetical protein